jgi:lysozyme
MADIATIRRYITFNEGKKNHVYNDSLGIPTIGVGFNLKRGDAPAKIGALGLSYDDVVAGDQDLTDDQIDTLLDADIETAINNTAKKIYPGFDDIDTDRQVILVDLSFNMGYSRLSGFKNTNAAINSGDWETAADELKNSNWYKQVGNRAVRNVETIRSGKLPNF